MSGAVHVPAGHGRGGATLPLRYGCRVLLYRQSQDGFVVATSSAEAPLGLQRDDPQAVGEQRLDFEQAIFAVAPGDPVDANSGNRGDGDVVKYGQTIRLIHQTHQQPLSHHTEQHAVGLKGNLRALLGGSQRRGSAAGAAGGGLSGAGAAASTAASAAAGGAARSDRWRVMPRYRLRVEGEPVADGDPVLLQSTTGARYLNVAEQFDEVTDGCFLEISCGAAIQGFQVHIYDADVGPLFRASVLRCGDCITLLHTEEHKYVTADLDKQVCYLRTAESKLAELGDEGEIAPSLSTTLISQGSGGGGVTDSQTGTAADAVELPVGGGSGVEEVSYLSTFFVEGVNPRYGGAVRSRGTELYRLKCLATGMYLRTGAAEVNPEDVEYDEALLMGTDGAPTNDARSLLSGMSASYAGSGVGGTFAAPENTVYELGLTANRLDEGTVFRVCLASSGQSDFVSNGNRVFLQAASTPHGAMWLVAGGRLDDDDVESEITVATLARKATTHGSVALYARPSKSMRDGIELRRLPGKAARELHMIRGLLPPLERYAANMADGVGDPFRVREVRENMSHLQRLCYQRSTTGKSGRRHAGDAGGGDGAGEDEGLMDARNTAEGYLNPAWQSKLFQQGVPSLVLRVAEATVRCPYVQPHLLHTVDTVRPPEEGVGGNDDDVDDAADPMWGSGGGILASSSAPSSPTGEHPSGGEVAGRRPRRGGRRRKRFVPMRYSDLGDLVDSCFDFAALLVSDRPKYAESLRAHVDFIVECCTHMPSALRCLAVVFHNNPSYVELPMAKTRLDFFLGLLAQKGRDPDVLRVIRRFTRCGEESMIEAQRVVLEFFSDTDNANKFLCPVQMMPPPAVMLAGGGGGGADGATGAVDGTGDVVDDGDTPAGNPLLSPTGGKKHRKHGDARKAKGDALMGQAGRLHRASRLTTTAAGEMAMVGLPHGIFVEEQTGDSMSIATSTQYRGKGSALGELLLAASNAEDAAGMTFFPLEGLRDVLQDWSEVKDVFVPYFAEQLMLFSALASGRHTRACDDLIFRWVPKEVLALMMASDMLPTSIHAAFVALFSHAVVDVGGSMNLRQDIRNIRCVITGAAGESSAVSAYSFRMGRTPAPIPAAKAYVQRYMATVAVSGDEEVATEYLHTLQLAEALVNGGAFGTEEYPHLIEQLVDALHPASDDTSTHLEFPLVYECKGRVLRLLSLIMDLILTRKALELVDCFREHASAPAATQLFQFTFDEFLQRVKIAAGVRAVAQPVLAADGLTEVERLEHQPLTLMAGLSEALMQTAHETESMRVRRQCIFLFLRVTNYMEELYFVANRVQLLTSEASIGFYSDINNTSASIEFLLRRSFRRSNTHVLAHEALDALDRFLSVADYGAAIEKFAMMRHVGIPGQLLAMIRRLPLPIRDSGRRIIYKTVSLLQTMAQDRLIHEELRRDVAALAPLAMQDANVIALLRSLYVQGASERCIVPFGVIDGIAQCLCKAHSACAAADFLTELLSICTSSGHPITQHQQLVWRALVSNGQVVQQIQFRHSWCGDRGREIREKVLTSRDYYVSTGRLGRHLGLCHLIYLISIDNELVKPEEIRHEVFGLNSVDVMLAVTTDAQLPVFFRKPYVALTETLILDDPPAMEAIFAHRSFGEFVRLCTMDCARYLQLLGGSNFFPEVDEDLERREDAAMRCAPVNSYEHAIDDARFGVKVYEGLVFGPICGCVRRVCRGYRKGVERLSNRLRSQLKLCVNEMVDILCDLVQLSFREDSRGAAVRWSALQEKLLFEAMRAAKEEEFHGTGRWRGDPFMALYDRFERRAKNRVAAVEALAMAGVPAHAMVTVLNGSSEDDGDGTGSTTSTAGDMASGLRKAAASATVESGGNLLDDDIASAAQRAAAAGGAPTAAAAAAAADKSKKKRHRGFLGRNPIAAVAVAVTGGGGGSSDDDSDDDDDDDDDDAFGDDEGTKRALTSQWVKFLQHHLVRSPYMSNENVFLTAAGIILRSGDRGSDFLQTLFCSLASMSGPNTARLLLLTRQTVRLAANNPLDDSILLPLENVTTDSPCLRMEMPRTARQALLARWPGDASLENPVPLTALVGELVGSTFPGVRRAALETMNTLLQGGHRGMQDSYNNYCKRITNERLFFILRNHLSEFLDALRRFYQAIVRGSTAKNAAHFLGGLPLASLELQLIQLLCANQYTPLQRYLSAQPDNDVSVNLIESLVELLSMGPKVANEVSTPFFLQLLRTISETLQGPCQMNQDSFVAYGAADYLTLLLADQSVTLRPNGGFTSYEEVLPRERRRQRGNLVRHRALLEEAVTGVPARDVAAPPSTSTTPHAGKTHGKKAGAGDTGKKRRGRKGRGPSGGGDDDDDGDEWGEEDPDAPTLQELRHHCMTRIHTAALGTLLGLIEGRQEPGFIARVLSTVDMAVLVQSMDQSVRAYEALHGSVERVHSHGIISGDFVGSFTALKRYLRDYFRGDHRSDSEELQDELSLAVSIFIFFRACYDMQQLAITRSLRGNSMDGEAPFAQPTWTEFLDKRGRSIKQVLRKTDAHQRMGGRVGKVEVMRDGALERVYFRILISSEDNLYKRIKDNIIQNAVRTSDNERIQSFFGYCTSTIVEINMLARMRGVISVYMINYAARELSLLALGLILALNLTMVIGIRAPTSPYEPGTAHNIVTALNGLGIAIICVQGTLLLQALSGPATVKCATNFERWRATREERVTQMARRDMAADRSELLQDDDRHKPTGFQKALMVVYAVVTEKEVLQHAFFLFVCIMGYVQHPIWYSVQLLQIMFNSPVLQNLITALSRNIASLVLTLVLLLFVIFVFTTISFYFFSELFNPLGLRGNGFNCYTLSQCFLVHVDNMRQGGGIGDTVDWPTYYSKLGLGYWFTFFRLAYYLFVCLILSNLFLGVIVDSLAQLRQENEFIHVDQGKKCFICGVERNVFDVVQPGTYDTHVEEEHNMWHYVHFLHYLAAKDPAAYTGQEAYVSRLVALRDVTFFPIGRSIVLATLMGGEEGEAAGSGGGGGGGGVSAEMVQAAVEANMESTTAALNRATEPLRRRADDTHEMLLKLTKAIEAMQRQQQQQQQQQQSPNSTPMPEGVLMNASAASVPTDSTTPAVSFVDPNEP